MGWRKRPLAYVSALDLPGVCNCRVRLELLIALSEAPREVTGLARARELDISHVSHHLHALASAGLIEYSQRGHERLYRLTEKAQVRREGSCLSMALESDDGAILR